MGENAFWKFEFIQGLINSKFYMWHPDKQLTIPSCQFIIIYYLWHFGFPFFPPFISFPSSAETTEEPLVDLADVLNTGADILGVLGKPSGDSGASNISQAVTVTEYIIGHLWWVYVILYYSLYRNIPRQHVYFTFFTFVIFFIYCLILIVRFGFYLLFSLFCLHHFILLGFGFL